MTVAVHAAEILAPSEDVLEAVTAYLADNLPALVPGQVLTAFDAVTGATGEEEAVGATDTDSWTLDAGTFDPPGAALPLATMIVDLAALAPGDGESFAGGASLAIRLEADTVKGTFSGAIAMVMDIDGFDVIDETHLVPIAASGAATITLAGIGLAASDALSDGTAVLVVGFISDIDANTQSVYDIDSFTLSVPEAVGGPVSSNTHVEDANCMLIAVLLNDACEIVEDAPVLVTGGVAELTPTVRTEDGADYSSPNFGGVVCGPENMADTIEKGVDLEGSMCLIDWSFMAMTTGNPKVVNGAGHTIGYQQLKRLASPCDPTARKPHIALTIIRAAASDDAGCVGTGDAATGATTAVAHTYPNTTDWTWGISPHTNERAKVPFKCKGYTNPNPGRGPLNLYPAGATPPRIEAGAFYLPYFVDPADLPTINPDEMLAHPAPLGKL